MTRSFWLRQLHLWHRIAGSISLSAMFLFAATGLTLNNAWLVPKGLSRSTDSASVPAEISEVLGTLPEGEEVPMPAGVVGWVADNFRLNIAGRSAEVSPDEIWIDLPEPGGDGALSLPRGPGEAVFEHQSQGWVAWANDLHKGRNTGSAWSWFIDFVAAAALIFSATGLALLWMQARARPSTWPLVSASALVPVLILLLFVH